MNDTQRIDFLEQFAKAGYERYHVAVGPIRISWAAQDSGSLRDAIDAAAEKQPLVFQEYTSIAKGGGVNEIKSRGEVPPAEVPGDRVD